MLYRSSTSHIPAPHTSQSNDFKLHELPSTRTGKFSKIAELNSELLGLKFKGKLRTGLYAYVVPLSHDQRHWPSLVLSEREKKGEQHFLRYVEEDRFPHATEASKRPILVEGEVRDLRAPADLRFLGPNLHFAVLSYGIPSAYHSPCGRPSLLGKGLASFLVSALEEQAFHEGVDVLVAQIDEMKTASENLALSKGFNRKCDRSGLHWYYKKLR